MKNYLFISVLQLKFRASHFDKKLVFVALKMVGIVGTALVLINYSAEIFGRESWSLNKVVKLLVTAFSPFIVTLWSRMSIRAQAEYYFGLDKAHPYPLVSNLVSSFIIALMIGGCLNLMNYYEQAIALITEGSPPQKSASMLGTFLIPFLVSSYGKFTEWKTLMLKN